MTKTQHTAARPAGEQCPTCKGEGRVQVFTGTPNSEGGQDWRVEDCPTCSPPEAARTERAGAGLDRKRLTHYPNISDDDVKYFLSMRPANGHDIAPVNWNTLLRFIDTLRDATQQATQYRERAERAEAGAKAWKYLMNGIEALAEVPADFTPDKRVDGFIEVWQRQKAKLAAAEAEVVRLREAILTLSPDLREDEPFKSALAPQPATPESEGSNG